MILLRDIVESFRSKLAFAMLADDGWVGDGSLGRLSLMDLLGAQSTPRAPNLQDSLESPIVGLHKVTNLRTQQDFVFGTAEDGSVAVWDLG
jgi:hypothetical protein